MVHRCGILWKNQIREQQASAVLDGTDWWNVAQGSVPSVSECGRARRNDSSFRSNLRQLLAG